MKKIFILIALLSLMPLSALAKNSNYKMAELKVSETAEPTETPEVRKTETAEPTETKEATETPEVRKTQTSEPSSGTDERGKSAESEGISKAVHDLLDLAKQLDEPGIGQQVSTIAKAQETNQSQIDQHISNAQRRSSFAKFFIGANFKELKEAKRLIAQNNLEIDNLKGLILKVNSQADKDAITAQIIVLEEQNKSLQNQIDQLASGFSLFGWLNKLVNKY